MAVYENMRLPRGLIPLTATKSACDRNFSSIRTRDFRFVGRFFPSLFFFFYAYARILYFYFFFIFLSSRASHSTLCTFPRLVSIRRDLISLEISLEQSRYFAYVDKNRFRMNRISFNDRFANVTRDRRFGVAVRTFLRKHQIILAQGGGREGKERREREGNPGTKLRNDKIEQPIIMQTIYCTCIWEKSPVDSIFDLF